MNRSIIPVDDHPEDAIAVYLNEIAQLLNLMSEAKWLLEAATPHTMEWHDRADAWYNEFNAFQNEGKV